MQEISDQQLLSKRVAGLKPSGIRKFFDIAATMKDVISLGVGEPDFTTPKPILEAGVQSLRAGENSLHFQCRETGTAPGDRGASQAAIPCKLRPRP